MDVSLLRRPLLLLTLLATLAVGAACSGPGRMTQEPAQAEPAAEAAAPSGAATSPVEWALRRPLPHPLTYPANFAEAVEAGTRTTEGRPGPAYWQQQARYELAARVLPDEKRLEGTALITYTNDAPQPLPVLVVELVQNFHAEGAQRAELAEVTGGMELTRVSVDGQPVALGTRPAPGTYLEQGTLLGLFPPQPLAPDSTVQIELDFAYDIPQAGASGRMGYSEDNLVFLAYWYPVMAVYDDVLGWFTDPFLGTSEFYMDWASYDVTIEAPENWIVYGTGTLRNPDEVLAPDVIERMNAAHASDTPMTIVGPGQFDQATAEGDDGVLRWHFTAENVRDVAYSLTRASVWDAARTSVGDRDGDGTTDYAHINTFYRERAPLWSEVTAYQQHAIRFLSDYTGFPYPYPHMTAVEGADIIGGGMEYPMMTLMGDYTQRGDSALYNVTAHELAHMWIPMIAGPNERRYSWIDEGSTSFAENQARKAYYGGTDPGRGDQANYLQVALAGMEGEIMRRSAYHYPGPAFGTASYSKPASLLRALRAVVGEDAFHEAYRSFIADWAYKHPYPYDFFNTFERVAGRDLDWFWYSWYYTTWTLDQAVADVSVQDGRTVVTVEDQGRVPMPVLLTITTESGETLERRIPVDTWLDGATEATVTVDTAAPVTRVEIDAGYAFPDADRSDNVWTR